MKTKISQVLSNKTVAVLFAFVLSLFGMCLWNISEMSVYASESEFTTWDDTTYEDYAVATYNGATAKTYIGSKAPSVDGYVFAGWFTDGACTVEQAIRSTSSVGDEDTCYAKFVPEGVLSTKVQVSNGDVNSDTTEEERNMRFVSSVDNLVYQQIGFRMKYQDSNGDWIYKINTGKIVFERIVSATAGDEYKFSPKVVNTKSEYFMTATWKGEDNTGIEKNDFDTDYYVRAYWVTLDGVRVYGPTRYVSVNDGINTNIVNVSVDVPEAADWTAESELNVTYTDSDAQTCTTTASVAYIDSANAQLRIDLGTDINRSSKLSSATAFTVSDGTNSTFMIYRNLYTAYAGSTTEDVSWHTVYGDTDEYVIATSADLYGMEYLANYNGGGTLETFRGKKIYVVADITVNEGTASVEHGWTAKESGATVYPWYAARGFAGTFDGQGHTISGLKGASDTEGGNHYALGIGLFTETSGAIIKDLSIVNSYYTSNGNGTGGLVGQGSGTFTNIHTDVIINSTHQNAGGIVGKATGDLTIENSWSNCMITTKQSYAGGIIATGNGQTVNINHCLNTGNITISDEYTAETAYTGGIIGKTGVTVDGILTGDFKITDCLNTGIIKAESTTVTKAIGGLLGQATGKNSDGNQTVVIADSYSAINYDIDGTTVLGTEKSVGSDSRSDKTEGEVWIYQDLYDMNAFSNTDLSFDGYDTEGYWAIRDDDTPMLVSFLEDTDKVIGLTGRSKTEFVIVDGVGYISVLSQLEDFRDKINDGTVTFAEGDVALMTDDIAINEDADAAAWADGSATLPATWTPIYGFTGIFDGQGYTLSGLYTNVQNKTGTGLFTMTDGVTIRNLSVTECYINVCTSNGTGTLVGRGNGTFENIHVDSIITDTSTKGRIGGLIGSVSGTTVITNCWSECDITSNKDNVGGFIGYTNDVFTHDVQVSHCLNSGNLTYTGTNTNVYYGGIVGRISSTSSDKWAGNLEIEDCLNIGNISPSTLGYSGGILGYGGGNETTTVTNCHSVINRDSDDELLGVEAVVGKYGTGAVITDSTAIDYDNSLGINSYYYTNLDLYSSSNPCAYWAARSEATPILVSFYEGTALNISDMTDETMTLTNNKGYIANAQQLLDFATQVDAGKTDSSTVITIVNNLDMHDDEGNKHAWTPIGADGTYFTGTFDGGGHTISGLAISTTTNKGSGLFATVNGITVKNLSIIDSTIETYDNNGTGVVAGKGYGTFENIYVDVEFTETSNNYVGGIIGYACTSNSIITNCWNASDILSSGLYCGGLLGGANTGLEVTVKHCLNTGDITYTGTNATQKTRFGGIVGRGNTDSGTTGNLTVSDCLNVGVIDGYSQTWMGGILGSAAAKGTAENKTTVIEDSYTAVRYTESGEQKGVSELVGAYASATYTVTTDSAPLNYDELIGFEGYCNTTLDFISAENPDGYWVVVKDGTPILASFVTEDTETIDVSGLSKTEFNLVDNVGLIWNADQLISFSEKMQLSEEERGFAVNSDTVVMLLNDIVLNEDWKASATAPDNGNVWVPIVNYVGTFDGQGYTISGIYGKNVSGIAGLGLFTQTTATTVIRNLNIANSYFVVTTNAGSGAVVGQGCGTFENLSANATLTDGGTRGRLAGILGVATGTTTIKNCWSDCTITTGGQNVGGILAFSNPLGQTITITNCLNTGDLNYAGSSDSNSHFGGIVGRTASTSQSSWAGRLTIKNCLNTGYVAASKGYYGGILGYASGNVDGVATTVISNCYSALNFDSTGAVTGANDIVGVWGVSAEGEEPNEFNCAMIADYNLVGDLAYNYTGLDYWSSANTKAAWAIRENDTPMLATFVTDADVVLDPIAEGWTTFTLTNNAGTIANLYQLRSFASQMNEGTLSVDANTIITLTDDITVSGGNSANWADGKYMTTQPWTAINEFPGTFDGGNYTISGVYGVKETGIDGVGFFTDTEETTVIKNLKITNSYFVSGDMSGVAAVVGRGAGTLSNIYSDAIIVDADAKGRAAGIVGLVNGTLTISNCWNAGDITATNYYVGGIVANANGNTVSITNCLNTGDVTLSGDAVMANDTTNAQMGGIIGKTGSGSATAGWGGNITITNCLNMGTVKSEHATATDYIGSVVGYATGANTVTNEETSEVTTTYTVTIENAYSSINYDENNEIVGTTVIIGSDKGASLTNCECIDYDLLLGEYGYYYLPFDFVTVDNADGVWSARVDSYPVLSSFVTDSDTVLTEFNVNKTATTAATFYATNAYNTAGTPTTSTTIGNDGMVVNITSSSTDEVTEYAETLVANGFIQYSETTIDTSLADTDNTFYTFVGNGLHAYLSWYPAISTARLVLTPNETLPSLREVQVAENDTVTPSVTQMQLDGVGMSYVTQLANGEFIIIDGGTRTDTDHIRLYEYLCEKVSTTGDTPVIACWMFTHPDPDHIANATKFLYNYRNDVEIESFAYNFAGETLVTTGGTGNLEATETDANIIASISTLEERITSYYPGARTYTIHAGQTYSFKGVEIEILQTEEDFYPNTVTCWNDTCASWRMKFADGQTALFLGDSMTVLNTQLANTYGSYLKSDMLQMAHHGLYGGYQPLYEYVNPTVCFWSTTTENYNSDTYRSLGYNNYLLTSGNRTFYWNAHMGTVLLEDGGVSPQDSYTKEVIIETE